MTYQQKTSLMDQKAREWRRLPNNETGLPSSIQPYPRIKDFLSERVFFKLASSKAYCRSSFHRLNDEDEKALLGFLTEFAKQPFIKNKTVSPDLISKVFSPSGSYLCWVDS